MFFVGNTTMNKVYLILSYLILTKLGSKLQNKKTRSIYHASHVTGLCYTIGSKSVNLCKMDP